MAPTETLGQYQVAWLNARPYCWCASTDYGKTWTKLNASDDENSSKAVDEASAKSKIPVNQWNLVGEPITKLN